MQEGDFIQSRRASYQVLGKHVGPGLGRRIA
jgi:hypothetical protein